MLILRTTAFLLLLLLLSHALAAVTLQYDDTNAFTGEGFVGKGDVQTAFDWNNAELQEYAQNLVFTYDTLEVLEQDCSAKDSSTTPPTFIAIGQRTKTTSLSAEVLISLRTKTQVTGFNLVGITEAVDSVGRWVGPNGETSGNACPDGYTPHGEARVVTSSATTLTVWYYDTGVVLWQD
jgi:hypothetical protein